LAAILFTAAGQESTGQGALLLFIYGTGMTLPFVLAAFFIGPFMKWLVKFRRHLGAVEKVMGIMLIMFGLLIATNSMNFVAQLMLDFIPWFQTIG
jgi:cytochrome c-type biogenesis protein